MFRQIEPSPAQLAKYRALPFFRWMHSTHSLVNDSPDVHPVLGAVSESEFMVERCSGFLLLVGYGLYRRVRSVYLSSAVFRRPVTGTRATVAVPSCPRESHSLSVCLSWFIAIHLRKEEELLYEINKKKKNIHCWPARVVLFCFLSIINWSPLMLLNSLSLGEAPHETPMEPFLSYQN